MGLGPTSRRLPFHEGLTPGEAVTLERYAQDVDVTCDLQGQAATRRSASISPLCDDPVGHAPKGEAFLLWVDLQTYGDAAHRRAPVVILLHHVPDPRSILERDRKHACFDVGLPEPPKGGCYRTAHAIYERSQARLQRELDYRGWPIQLGPFGPWSGGPLTEAMALRSGELLAGLHEAPAFVRDLLDFVTEATIARIRALLRFVGLPDPAPEMISADEALQLLSAPMAREFLLPVYRRPKGGASTAEHIRSHLCGDATRHFRWLRDDLGVFESETGFPVDLGRLRDELGDWVTLQGGPDVMLLRQGAPKQVVAETERNLSCGVCRGGGFILREGHRLAPGTPQVNLAAMFAAACQWTPPS